MLIWRICKQQFAAQPFTGIGARLFGGRWNDPGREMVYCAGSLALAALETFVHLDTDLLPTDLIAVSAELGENINRQQIHIDALPDDWRTYPAPDTLRQLGNQWLIANQTAVLVVPSAVIPLENNYLLNPAHPDFNLLRIHEAVPFQFDPRMFS